jgi:predicted Fe-S protein YdhL (DUF1289 family)
MCDGTGYIDCYCRGDHCACGGDVCLGCPECEYEERKAAELADEERRWVAWLDQQREARLLRESAAERTVAA